MNQLDKIGKQAAKLLQDMEGNRKLAQPLLTQIWGAFEDAKKNQASISINGAANKKDWAAQAKVSLRYCQYILKDGSRKSQTRTTVRALDGMTIGIRGLSLDSGYGWVEIEFEKATVTTYKGKIDEKHDDRDWSQTPADKKGIIDWLHKTADVEGKVGFTVEDQTLTEERVIGELLKKMKAGLKAMHLWDEKLVADYKQYVKDHQTWTAEKKESRSQSAKKAAENRRKATPVKKTPTKTAPGKERKVHAVDPHRDRHARNAMFGDLAAGTSAARASIFILKLGLRRRLTFGSLFLHSSRLVVFGLPLTALFRSFDCLFPFRRFLPRVF